MAILRARAVYLRGKYFYKEEADDICRKAEAAHKDHPFRIVTFGAIILLEKAIYIASIMKWGQYLKKRRQYGPSMERWEARAQESEFMKQEREYFNHELTGISGQLDESVEKQ